MAPKDVQDYLDKGMYGTPQIKPDEKKKYLGTFRERVVFILTAEEMTNHQFDTFCQEQFNSYPEGHILINANVDMDIQNRFMQLAQKTGRSFRLVDTDEATISNDDIALVYAVDTAINIDNIRASIRSSKKSLRATSPRQTESKSSKPFFKKLFSKE